MRRRNPFQDEKGLTTAGVAIALLVTLSLVFSSGQVYRVNAAASEAQSVADAAALAAENEVAEFMVVVRVCDAVVLSLSCASLVATGLGVAALCTPATAAASQTLIKAGREVSQARDSFAEKAASGLNRLQRLVPFLAAANAASVAAANNRASSNYLALAILAASQGEDIKVGGAPKTAAAEEAVDARSAELQQAADEAQRAAEKANEAKLRGFQHDCGANPAYCMYERAFSLGQMSGADNPLFRSVDTWSFSVALKRAQAYYPRRLAAEAPQGSSVEEQARSALRTRFYIWAAKEVQSGYVRETDASFEAYFPRLPKNTAQMRETLLYEEAVYPCAAANDGRTVMHAWEGCPNAAASTGFGSIAQMEAGAYPTCEQCGFTASSMGKVAAASTSIENGFEYHYQAVADAAQEYQRERAAFEPFAHEVKDKAESLFDQIKSALGEVASMRIDARPPGSQGVVVLVANTGSTAASSGFESLFVKASGTLGARAAVSSATLVADPSGEGSSVISSLLDGVADQGAAVGAAGIVLDCWSALLQAYADGQKSLDRAVRTGLDDLPLAGASGLGTWAAGALREAVSAVGLQPAKLDALKPVLVNSAHVAASADDAFGARLLSLKEQAIAHPLQTGDVFTSVVGAVEQEAVDDIRSFDGKVRIATIELFGEGGPGIPIELSLPPALRHAAIDVVQRAADGLRSVYAQITGVRVWE